MFLNPEHNQKIDESSRGRVCAASRDITLVLINALCGFSSEGYHRRRIHLVQRACFELDSVDAFKEKANLDPECAGQIRESLSRCSAMAQFNFGDLGTTAPCHLGQFVWAKAYVRSSLANASSNIGFQLVRHCRFQFTQTTIAGLQQSMLQMLLRGATDAADIAAGLARIRLISRQWRVLDTWVRRPSGAQIDCRIADRRAHQQGVAVLIGHRGE